MKKNDDHIKSRRRRLIIIGIMIQAFLLLALAYLGWESQKDNEDLLTQIDKRDTLIKVILRRDSILSNKNDVNKSIVEKYIDDCGIIINGKKVSTSELLAYMNNQIKQNSSLEDEKIVLKDSLIMYQTLYDILKKRYNVKYSVSIDSGRKFINMRSFDSISIYKKIYNDIVAHYGIKYDISYENGVQYMKRKISAADSALVLFPYYRNKIARDTGGNWEITLPDKK